MNSKEIADLIHAGLPGSQAVVKSPDDVHFEAVVVASAFEGKRPVQRHQLVYATLGSRVGNEIHALALQVLTPAEAQQQAQS